MDEEKVYLSFSAWQMLKIKNMDNDFFISRLVDEMYEKEGAEYWITKEDAVNFINKILKEKEEYGK